MKIFCFYKNWIDSGVFYIKSILNEDETFMTVKSFICRIMCDINTNNPTYIGCVQAVKNYVRKTGLKVEKNKSIDLTKTLKVIYSAQKGASLLLYRLTVKKTVVTSGNIN